MFANGDATDDDAADPVGDAAAPVNGDADIACCVNGDGDDDGIAENGDAAGVDAAEAGAPLSGGNSNSPTVSC